MSDSRRLAAEVGAKADLLDVALRSVNAELALPAGVEQVEMDVSWETSFERRANSLVEYRHRVAVRDATGTFFIRGELALIYALSATSDFSDDQLHGFGEVSVAFSAFPYVRELVHTLTTRASLPPLILGTLRSPLDPPASLASNARGQGVKKAAKPKRTAAAAQAKKRSAR
ncbi:MAG TPA: hypothetical protein VIR58_12055 [Acidimicrobiales bacterium]